MMGRSDFIGGFIDLQGKRFGLLKVLKRSGTAGNGSAVWLCKCDCGKTAEVRSCSLRSGHTKSCGRCPVNSYTVKGNITVGKTATGKEFIFDTVFLPLVTKYTWHLDERNCVRTIVDGSKSLRLHTLIMGYVTDLQIDHINNDPSDNRKENLRVVNQQQNIFNNSIRADNTSGFKGVSFNKKAKKYQATIVLNGKSNYLGLFKTALEAAKAYNQKAIELFGEYAFLNSI